MLATSDVKVAPGPPSTLSSDAQRFHDDDKVDKFRAQLCASLQNLGLLAGLMTALAGLIYQAPPKAPQCNSQCNSTSAVVSDGQCAGQSKQ